jgi:uncharacterized membrane protein
LLQAIYTVLWTIAPISELRGGIPWGIANGLNPWLVVPLCIACNILVFFPWIWLLDLLYEKVFSRWALFNLYLDRVRRRGEHLVHGHGHWGLAIFIGIPLPWTGVYSGTLLAWVLGVERRKALLAVSVGVVIAAVLVTLATYGIIAGAGFFTRMLHG